MEPNSRKRKAEIVECDSSSSGSVKFVMECKKKGRIASVPKQEFNPSTPIDLFTTSQPSALQKLDQTDPEEALMMTSAKTSRLKESKKTEGLRIETNGFNRDEALREVQLVVSNCEDRIRDLQEKNEEWKEIVATRALEANDFYDARLAKVEKGIQVEDVLGLPEKIEDIKKEYRDELAIHMESMPEKIEDIKKGCQDEIDVRLRGFAGHMMRFFSENLSPGGTQELTTGPSNNAHSVTSSESKPIGSVETHPCTTDSHFALGLSGNSFSKEPRLTNQGYQQLMRNFNFQNVSQLAALSKTDRREDLRDCNLFCDISHPTLWIDYVLRIGGSSSLVMNETLGVIYKHHPALAHTDLSQLRIFELQLSAQLIEREAEFREWKKRFSPPKYVYELGQLFTRRRFHKANRTDIVSTVYNLVMDVSKQGKPVWMIARPGCVLMHRKRNDKDSTLPFNGTAYYGMVCLAEKIEDLSFTHNDFARNSYSAFLDAENLVNVTGCRVELNIESRAADITEMENAISRR